MSRKAKRAEEERKRRQQEIGDASRQAEIDIILGRIDMAQERLNKLDLHGMLSPQQQNQREKLVESISRMVGDMEELQKKMSRRPSPEASQNSSLGASSQEDSLGANSQNSSQGADSQEDSLGANSQNSSQGADSQGSSQGDDCNDGRCPHPAAVDGPRRC